jgi:hypothetical protein
LNDKEKEVNLMEETIDGLQKFYDSHSLVFERRRGARSQSNRRAVLMASGEEADPESLHRIQENLDRQNEVISKLVTDVKEMQTRVSLK